MSQISIIILNYNTTSYTETCLNSLLLYKDNHVKEIIVTDNNSTDRSIELLQDKFPEVKFYFKKDNDGFAGGCNFGASKATGDYLLFLNPDVSIKCNLFSKLSDHLDSDIDAGILSGVMTDENGNVQYFYNDYPDVSWEISCMYLPLVEKKINKLNSNPFIAEKKKFYVDWFHGAFIFIRKTDFESLGRFNENYFMYYEDVELCYKMKNVLNKNNVCLPELKYYHSRKSSLANEKTDEIYTFHLNRSKLLFISNYNFLKSSGVYLAGLGNVLSRLLILPFWKKYSGNRKQKYIQLKKVLKLYFSRSYLLRSKYEYIK